MTTDLFRSALARMKPYTPGEQPRGGQIVKLNTNENPFPPSPKVVEAIREAASGTLNRYPDPMADRFREAAARVLGLPGPEWILAGNGSDEILTILVRAFVGEGQSLRLPYPSYILYRTLADIQGARWEQRPFQNDWSLDRSFAEAEVSDSSADTRLLMIPNPNSPSGTVLGSDQIETIADAFAGVTLVDEAYVDFAENHCVDLARRHRRVVVSRTFSKSYALAGIRFGYLVANPDLICELSKIKDSYNCDAISIAAATAAIEDQSWLRQCVDRLCAIRDASHQRFVELGFNVLPSQANFLWMTHPSGRHREIYESLKSESILIRYMDFEGWGDGLRISIGTEEQMDLAIDAIRRALSRLSGQPVTMG